MPFLFRKRNNDFFVQTLSFLPSCGDKPGNRGEEFSEPCYVNKLTHQESLVMSPARDTSTIASPCCASLLHISLPAASTPVDSKIIKNKRWMLSTREWLTFLPTNTTSRKWLARRTSRKCLNFLPSKFAWLLNFSSRTPSQMPELRFAARSQKFGYASPQEDLGYASP